MTAQSKIFKNIFYIEDTRGHFMWDFFTILQTPPYMSWMIINVTGVIKSMTTQPGEHGGGKKHRAHVQLSGNKSGAVSGTGAYPAVPGLVFQPWCTLHHHPGSPRPFSGF